MNDKPAAPEKEHTKADDILSAFARDGAHPLPATVHTAGALGATEERLVGAQKIAVLRDEEKILRKLRALAAAAGSDWYYRFPVKRKQKDGTVKTEHIEGPSIKCANNTARLYGNCDVDCRVFDLGDSWVFYSRFVDLETGFSLTRPFQQRKSQKTLGTADEARALDIAFQIGASKAIRNVVCNALETFTSFAFDEAKSALVDKIGKALEKYREKVVARLKEMNVDVARVELCRGRPAAQWLAPDVAYVIAEIQAIQDGMATIDETWPAAGAMSEVARKEEPNERAATSGVKTRKAPKEKDQATEQKKAQGEPSAKPGAAAPQPAVAQEDYASWPPERWDDFRTDIARALRDAATIGELASVINNAEPALTVMSKHSPDNHTWIADLAEKRRAQLGAPRDARQEKTRSDAASQ